MSPTLQSFYDSQVSIIATLQGFQPQGWVRLMEMFSLLGEELAYLAMLPLIWYLVDSRLAAKIAITLTASFWVNSWIKTAAAQPRPFHLDSSIQLGFTDDYGLPSGHAQSALLFFGLLALDRKSRALSVFAGLLVGGVSFSRIYLGVHFITDVIAGWILAFLIGWVSVNRGAAIARVYLSWSWFSRIGLLALTVVVGVLLSRSNSALGSIGSFVGIVIGASVVYENGRMVKPRTLSHQVLALSATILGIGIFYIGLKTVFPPTGTWIGDFCRILRYGLTAFWIAYGPSRLVAWRERSPEAGPA